MAITDDLAAYAQKGGLYFALVVIIGILIILLIGLAIWIYTSKKKWNLKVEFKMIRSDGRITVPEWGKGNYNQREGVIWLKRKKKPKEGIKAKRLDKYLQGSNTLTVVGNPGNWRLVIPETYTMLVDDETGEEGAVIELRTDTKEDKSWAVNFERSAKEVFSVQSFMAQYGQVLAYGFLIMITILANFIGFSLVLGKIQK